MKRLLPSKSDTTIQKKSKYIRTLFNYIQNKEMPTLFFKLMQWMKSGFYVFEYVKFQDNVADMMTKSLGKVTILKLRDYMIQERKCAKYFTHGKPSLV